MDLPFKTQNNELKTYVSKVNKNFHLEKHMVSKTNDISIWVF